jgi:hypothetical protein
MFDITRAKTIGKLIIHLALSHVAMSFSMPVPLTDDQKGLLCFLC